MDGPEVRLLTAMVPLSAPSHRVPATAAPPQNIQGLSAIMQSRTRKDTAEDEWGSETESDTDSD